VPTALSCAALLCVRQDSGQETRSEYAIIYLICTRRAVHCCCFGLSGRRESEKGSFFSRPGQGTGKQASYCTAGCRVYRLGVVTGEVAEAGAAPVASWACAVVPVQRG